MLNAVWTQAARQYSNKALKKSREDYKADQTFDANIIRLRFDNGLHLCSRVSSIIMDVGSLVMA